MKTQFLKIIFLALIIANSSVLSAAEASTRITEIINPTKNIDVKIGDVLKRTVKIVANTKETIKPKALPIKGSRTDGVELIKFKLSEKKEGDQTQYVIELSYQVFANANKPMVIGLPEERISILDSENLVLPAWYFWYSPLVESNLEDAKKYVLSQDKAPPIEYSKNIFYLIAYASLLAVGLIGLIYINADVSLLPFMGGHFSRAHRVIKHINKSEENNAVKHKKALSTLHHSFNQTYGRNLFANEIETFFDKHPSFRKVQSEINLFFELSNQTLFANKNDINSGLMKRLLSLSKELRDCERGI